MKLPALNEIRQRTVGTDKFGGINKADGTPLGEWEELSNMDFSRYPALKSRAPREYNGLDRSLTGCMYKNDGWCYTVPEGIYIGGTLYPMTLSEGGKRLLSMGAYIIILPDFIICDTAQDPPKFRYLNGSEQSEEKMVGELREVNALDWDKMDMTAKTPVGVYKKLLFFVVSEDDPKLDIFRIGTKVKVTWNTSTYVGKSPNSYEKTEYMSIKSIVHGDDEEYNVVGAGKVGLFFETETAFADTDYFYTEDAPVTSARQISFHRDAVMRLSVPDDLEYLIEHNNRLWACSSKNHEIYCSKLGDPTSWGDYQGISTDSWAATVGSDGDFTGSAVHNGRVLFFKEDCVHVIYGTKPANFTLTTVHLRGVKKGSADSLCISNGLLYYKAPEGIFAYNGTTAQKADIPLGENITLNASACADDRKIYMMASDGKARVYDCAHGCWSCEDCEGAQRGFAVNGSLYALMYGEDTKELVQLSGEEDMAFCEPKVSFCAETGWINGENAAMSCFSKIRLSVGIDGDPTKVNFCVKAKYLDGEEWRTEYSYDGTNPPASRVFIIPIIPMRSQKIKLRIEGESLHSSRESTHAGLTLYGIYLNEEEGTELGGEH